MKKIFIYILLLLCVFFVACETTAEPAKTVYSIQSNSDGYLIGNFNISDIKIKIVNGDDVVFVPVDEDMLDRTYSFDKPGNYAVNVTYEDFSGTVIIIMKENPASIGEKDPDPNSDVDPIDNGNDPDPQGGDDDPNGNSGTEGDGGSGEGDSGGDDDPNGNSGTEGDGGSGEGNNGGDNGGGSTGNENPINGYKEITEKYIDYSGAALTDRVELEQIGTTLYVGNTFGLKDDVTYSSSNPSVIKINDNNVLICLKKGDSIITIDNETKIRITVEELELTADTYYSTIGYLPEMEAEDIKTILHNLIDEHISGSYALLKTILPQSDADPDNPSKMILLYTGRSQGGGIAQNNEPDGWNREHVWPLSKLGGDTALTAGHDAHHIRPADVSVNSARGNLEFGIASTIVSDTYAEGSSMCKKSDYYFEPRDEVKGDIARMLFYMAVRYEGDVSGEADLELVFDLTTPKNSYNFGNLELLLEWNRLDPVDDFERNRNNVIYTYQNNRNPFIDYPSLADLIWSLPE